MFTELTMNEMMIINGGGAKAKLFKKVFKWVASGAAYEAVSYGTKKAAKNLQNAGYNAPVNRYGQ